MEKLVVIDTDIFCAGLVFENGICIDAAPILKWSIGQSEKQIKAWKKIVKWTDVKSKS